MDIEEVSEILGLCHFLKAPKHIFITSEVVSGKLNGVVFYRGLQPKAKADAIFLSAQADQTTPVHETLHTLGLGEFGSGVLTRVIMRKNTALQNFPYLPRKPIRYQEVSQSKDYPDAHSDKFEGRVRHFVLQDAVQSGNY